MDITKNTKLMALLEEYPFLKEEALKISDKFAIIDSPIGKMLLKNASIADLCRKANLSEATVLKKIRSLIEAHEEK